MNSKIFKVICITSILILIIVGWAFFLGQIHSGYAMNHKQVIRLHVIANSDSPEDQAVKLKVRDAIVEYLSPMLAATKNQEEARQILIEQQEVLVQIARQVLAGCDKNYSANLEMGFFEFPVKSYGTMIFPAGRYEAMRIKLGNAEGKNWWCVLFPPLCLIDGANATAVPVVAADPEKPDKQAEIIGFKLKIYELLK